MTGHCLRRRGRVSAALLEGGALTLGKSGR
jgi:hypothetical protein